MGVFIVTTSSAVALSSTVVISQVFGGGGNSGAPYQNDFVELFNRGSTALSLDGWSIQYASATGNGTFASNPVTALSGTLQPGQYYLVQMA
ncbi:MAG TPA: lamin tail domain-containing protein, partial [Thermoleophilia bacterium]|nr:lamin tail domain-containing protein [Thermoleophilia bacterium]